MKNIKYIFIIAALIALSSVSCEILEEEIISGVTVDTHYNTPEGFHDAVNAAYKNLRDFYGDEDACEITVFGTDEYTNGGHGGAHDINTYDAGLNAESNSFWDPWQRLYIGINTCNAVIGRSADADVPEDEKAVLVGEVRFLRAHYYFLLVEFFGPVHLSLEETTGVITEANRTPEDQIYDVIIEDLEYAIDNLPETQTDFGRITKTAAQHHLALVYLTRAYKSYAEAGDFSNAADIAVDIINNSDRVLLDDYQQIYNIADAEGRLSHTNEQNAEIIFSVQYDIDPLLNGEGNRTHLYFRPWYEVYDNGGLIRGLGHGYGRPWIRFRPTMWFLENFRPLDVDSRYEKSFQTVWYYNTTDGIPDGAAVGDTCIWILDEELDQAKVDAIKARLPGVALFSWNVNDYGEPWSLWQDVVPNPNINIFPSPWKIDDNLRPSLNETAGSRDFIVFRLGETYLIAAEAMLGRDGNGSNAVDYINTIRRRAAYDGMENAIEVTAGEVDLDFILDEWSRECFGEQSRWLDLKRTGKLLERVKAYNPDAADGIKDYHVLRPIPAHQITRCTNNYPQNTGY
jgi:starch-binding outer membrane protein, SusD/RagB family